MRMVGLGGNTWPDPCVPHRFLCSNSQISGILGQLDLAAGLSLGGHSLSGCSYGHWLIVSKKNINWVLEGGWKHWSKCRVINGAARLAAGCGGCIAKARNGAILG